jgi:hypothetical protein
MHSQGLIDIRYGWRVSAPEKHIAPATTIVCIVQIILDVHNLLRTVQKGARTTILVCMNVLVLLVLHNLLGSVQNGIRIILHQRIYAMFLGLWYNPCKSLSILVASRVSNCLW